MSFLVRPSMPSDYDTLNAQLPQEFCLGGRLGWTAERDGQVVAIGSVTIGQGGAYWGWYNSIESLPAITMHRIARQMIDRVREVERETAEKERKKGRAYEFTALYAIADVSKPGAWKWLERLGFVRDESLTHEVGPVYRCNLERG